MDNKILIVDDAIFMRRIMREALTDSGFDGLLEAKDGDEAVALYKRTKPRIVLLDITMPGKSGMEVLSEIMAIDPNAVVIMCSAVGQEETIKKAVQRGAADYVTKPFKKDELAAAVRKHLS